MQDLEKRLERLIQTFEGTVSSIEAYSGDLNEFNNIISQTAKDIDSSTHYLKNSNKFHQVIDETNHLNKAITEFKSAIKNSTNEIHQVKREVVDSNKQIIPLYDQFGEQLEELMEVLNSNKEIMEQYNESFQSLVQVVKTDLIEGINQLKDNIHEILGEVDEALNKINDDVVGELKELNKKNNKLNLLLDNEDLLKEKISQIIIEVLHSNDE